MFEKCFEQDKNYLLKQAQADLEESLLQETISIAIENFKIFSNPLGLMDDFMCYLEKPSSINYHFVKKSYSLLSNIYRRIKGNNQLEILWDGSSHYEYYLKEWSDQYVDWQREMGFNEKYVRLILKGSLFHQSVSTEFLSRELEKMILKHFNVKIDRKGFISLAA